MTREGAEARVWERWRDASERGTGCEMRVDSTLTEEYEWGWIVTFVPVRPEERRQPYLHESLSPSSERAAPVQAFDPRFGEESLRHTDLPALSGIKFLSDAVPLVTALHLIGRPS